MSVAPLQRTASAEDVRRWLRSFLSPEESMLICAYHFDAKTLFEANDLGTLGSFLCKAVNIPANVALKIVNRLTECTPSHLDCEFLSMCSTTPNSSACVALQAPRRS